MSSTLLSKFLVASLLLFVLATPAWGQVGSRTFENSENDYITVSYSSELDVSNITVAAWINPVDNNTSNVQVLMGRNSGGTSIFQFDYDSQQNWLRFPIWTGPTVPTTGGGSITGSVWQFVAATYDGSNVRIYIDGVLSGGPTAHAAGMVTGSVDLYIGETDTTPTFDWDGEMAYVHYYDRALSLVELQAIERCPGSDIKGLVGYWPLTDSSTQYDYSGNGLDGTNTGTSASTDGPPVSPNCIGAGGN